MAHFAILDDHKMVQGVLVVNNESILDADGVEQESVGKSFLSNLVFIDESRIVQCSYNISFRKKYPAVGDFWREDIDAFISPRPGVSWTLNEGAGVWEPPISYPNDGGLYVWLEKENRWEQR